MSFFVYFNSESNKFNFLHGDGQLQISNGQPIIKSNNAEMTFVPACNNFSSHVIPLNSNNKYIVHINFNAINNDICFIDDITLEEALHKYCIEFLDSVGNVYATYMLCDSTNPIVHFNYTFFVENVESFKIRTNYDNLQIYEKMTSVVLETI